jgi:hypothetical protein
MKIRTQMSPATGAVAFLVASLVVYWIGSSPGTSEALARYGISVRSTESTGIPGSEAFGVRRELRGESYGAGAADLNSRSFLARSGQVLVLEYDAAVQGGYLRLSVDRGRFFREALWGRTVRADRAEAVRLPIPKTGLYQLTVTRYRHAGTYRVEWLLENP